MLSRCARSPRVLHCGFYARFAKVLPRLPLIVSSAAQPKILNRALAAHHPRRHVVELQAPARATALPIRRDIATLLAVSYRCISHRDVSRATDSVGLAGRTGRRSRVVPRPTSSRYSFLLRANTVAPNAKSAHAFETKPHPAVGAPRWPQASAWAAGRPQHGVRGRPRVSTSHARGTQSKI